MMVINISSQYQQNKQSHRDHLKQLNTKKIKTNGIGSPGLGQLPCLLFVFSGVIKIIMSCNHNF